MTLEVMQFLMYLVVAVAIVFYVVLDGFDLGVGLLHIFIKGDQNRRLFLNAIGPFWDGNEVWLIIIGGGLFVGFPDVYAVIFSGFYILFMILLAGIIFRTCAIEFRSKMEWPLWRSFWDYLFWLSSLMITFGAGILLGNLMIGVPIDQNRELIYSFWALFSPFPIFLGIFALFLFAMHGNHYLLMKLDGKIHKELEVMSYCTTFLFCLVFIAITIWTWVQHLHMVRPFLHHPLLMIVPLFMILTIVLMIRSTLKKKNRRAFVYSMLTITLLFVLYAIGTFPNMVISTISDAYTLTFYNASASITTLGVTLVIAAIGVPLVLLYGWVLYYTFRGKTRLHDHSY